MDNKKIVLIRVQIPENCGECRFCTDQYIECKTKFCTLGGHTIRGLKKRHKDCMIDMCANNDLNKRESAEQ